MKSDLRSQITHYYIYLMRILFLCIMHFFPQAFQRVTENTWAKKANLSISFTQVLIIRLPVMVKEPTQHT